MDASTYLAHVREAGEAIAAAGDRGELAAPVVGCPGYDLRRLLRHTGAVGHWIGACVEQREIAPNVEVDHVDPVAWHRSGMARLLAALGAVDDPTGPAQTWGADQRLWFWFRRAAQELAVHRHDAEEAVGPPGPTAIDPELAADGIDELFGEFATVFGLPTRFGGDGETIHLHAADVEGGEWLVRTHADRFEITREHGKGDVAARGTASDLLLLLWGRVPPEKLEVFGDARLLGRWQAECRI